VRSLGWAIGAARPTVAQFDYMRSQNFAVVGWWEKYNPEFFKDVPKREGDVPGQSVTVLQYPPRPFAGDATGIRRALPGDLSRCVALINSTHRGNDLFRTYTVESLGERLRLAYSGSHLDRWFRGRVDHAVYSLDDLYVLEEDGRIVACAGLWDRGRDVRDRWRHLSTGETKVVETTAVLDMGFTRGRADSMARLLRYLTGESHKLGRTFLTVPLDPFPKVASLLSDLAPVPEVRALRWGLSDLPLRTPHTDLVYW
jgi:hypothetical protein